METKGKSIYKIKCIQILYRDNPCSYKLGKLETSQLYVPEGTKDNFNIGYLNKLLPELKEELCFYFQKFKTTELDVNFSFVEHTNGWSLYTYKMDEIFFINRLMIIIPEFDIGHYSLLDDDLYYDHIKEELPKYPRDEKLIPISIAPGSFRKCVIVGADLLKMNF